MKPDLATLKSSLEVIVVKLRFELYEGELSPCCVHFQHRSFYTMSHIYTENDFQTHFHANVEANTTLTMQLRVTPITSICFHGTSWQWLQTNIVGNINLVNANKTSLAFGVKAKAGEKEILVSILENIISSPISRQRSHLLCNFIFIAVAKWNKLLHDPKQPKHSFLSTSKLPHIQHPTKNRTALSSR